MKMVGGNLEIFNEKQSPNNQIKNSLYFLWSNARLNLPFAFSELFVHGSLCTLVAGLRSSSSSRFADRKELLKGGEL